MGRKKGDQLSKATLRELESELREERDRLRGQLAELEETIDSSSWDDEVRSDPADAGFAVSELDQVGNLARNAQEILNQVEKALERMQEGTYGTCELCGDPIAKGRLEALPHATTCTGEHDRRPGSVA